MLELKNTLKDNKELLDIHNRLEVNMDLIHSIVGKEIGYGSFRCVYEYNLDPKYVVKVEFSGSTNNTSEFLLWEEIQELTGNLAWVKKWFAPILWTSPNKKIIVMQRTFEKPEKKRPATIPAFFSDVKQDNFGWIGNNLVCHDYGFLHKFIKYDKKFQKVVW